MINLEDMVTIAFTKDQLADLEEDLGRMFRAFSTPDVDYPTAYSLWTKL